MSAIELGAVETSVDLEKWTNIQVDSQVLSTFMACAQRYEYQFVRHLVPIGGMSKSIRKGSIVHDALLGYWRERIKSGDYKISTFNMIESLLIKATEVSITSSF